MVEVPVLELHAGSQPIQQVICMHQDQDTTKSCPWHGISGSLELCIHINVTSRKNAPPHHKGKGTVGGRYMTGVPAVLNWHYRTSFDQGMQ